MKLNTVQHGITNRMHEYSLALVTNLSDQKTQRALRLMRFYKNPFVHNTTLTSDLVSNKSESGSSFSSSLISSSGAISSKGWLLDCVSTGVPQTWFLKLVKFSNFEIFTISYCWASKISMPKKFWVRGHKCVGGNLNKYS